MRNLWWRLPSALQNSFSRKLGNTKKCWYGQLWIRSPSSCLHNQGGQPKSPALHRFGDCRCRCFSRDWDRLYCSPGDQGASEDQLRGDLSWWLIAFLHCLFHTNQLAHLGGGCWWRRCLCSRSTLPCCSFHLPEDSHPCHLKIYRSESDSFYHVKLKFRLPRAERDPESFGEREWSARMARSEGRCLGCGRLCHTLRVQNPAKIPRSFDYFSQVEGYTQGEEGVQEKMNQFVQWWTTVASARFSLWTSCFLTIDGMAILD